MGRPRYRRKNNKKGSGTRRQVYKNLKAIRLLKNTIEWKYKDYAPGSVNVNSTGDILLLNNVLVGDDESHREGNEVYARRLRVRGYFNNNHGSPSDCLVRLIFFRAKQPGGVAITIDQVLTSNTINAHRNMDEKTNFVVYYDQTFAMTDGSATGVNNLLPFKFSTNLKSKVRYNNTDAGTAVDMEKNGIYMLYMSTIAGTTDCPQMNFISRFSYTDS